MWQYGKKSIPAEIVDLDAGKRSVSMMFSRFENVDLVDDVMVPGSYRKSLAERGLKGLIYHVSNHRAQPEFILSKGIFEENTEGLVGHREFLDTTHATDVFKLYDAGLINQHSVFFAAPKGKWEKKGNITYYHEVILFEGSTVLWGANPDTPTFGRKSLLEELGGIDEMVKYGRNLIKALKNGTFTDDTFQLLEVQYNLVLSELADATKKATQPELATEPEPVVPVIEPQDTGLELIKSFRDAFYAK